MKEKNTGEWLYATLRAMAERSAGYKMTECFTSYDETEGLLVLLDGLDEVASSEYRRVEAAINGLSAKLF